MQTKKTKNKKVKNEEYRLYFGVGISLKGENKNEKNYKKYNYNISNFNILSKKSPSSIGRG